MPTEDIVAGPAGKGRRSGAAHGFALFLVFALEMLVFCVATRRHYAWMYPRWFDQAQYLSDAYAAYGQAHEHGFAAGVAAALGHESPQGALHSFLALLVFEVAGPSRVGALAVNLLGLVALQWATFAAVRKLSGSAALSWAALALVAALNSPWSGGGGSAVDFRLDWMAACAYGVALAVGLQGRGFRSTGWAALFGASVGIALLVRFLTVVYFGGIFVILFAWLALGPDRGRRLGRLVFSAVIAGAVAGWAFWRCRHLIYNYYWTGHYGGAEAALRAAHLGALGSVGWLLADLVGHHIGIGATVIGVGALVLFRVARNPADSEEGGNKGNSGGLGEAWVIASAFAAVPALVLLTHPEKAEPPVVIIAPAALWLLFLGWSSLAAHVPGRYVNRVSALVVICAGALFFASQKHDATPASLVPGYRTINSLADFIYYRTEEAGLSRPRVAVTWVSDSIDGESIRLLGFERHGRMIPYASVLPSSIFEETRAVILQQLKESEFVFVVTRARLLWPFDRQMQAMRPEVLTWCEANLVHDGDVETPEFSASIYERRGMDRPDGAQSLQEALARGLSGENFEVPPPPSTPAILAPEPVLWSTGEPLHYVIRAAYSPMTLQGIDLPEGIVLNAGSGEVTGRFPKAGDYVAQLVATNASGVSRSSIQFQVSDSGWDVRIDAPAKAHVGEPTTLGYSAFDSGGNLDFIDITDITASKVLVRISAPEDQRVSWQGRYQLMFNGPGSHRLIVRTVRYDPKANSYTYQDRECAVDVLP